MKRGSEIVIDRDSKRARRQSARLANKNLDSLPADVSDQTSDADVQHTSRVSQTQRGPYRDHRQSNRQSNLAGLTLLPEVLIAETLGYLTLDEKCRSLTSLNKQLTKVMQKKRSRCLSGPVTLNLPVVDRTSHPECDVSSLQQAALRKVEGRCQYVDRATSLSINIPASSGEKSKIMSMIEDVTCRAVKGGELRSLYVREKCPYRDYPWCSLSWHMFEQSNHPDNDRESRDSDYESDRDDPLVTSQPFVARLGIRWSPHFRPEVGCSYRSWLCWTSLTVLRISFSHNQEVSPISDESLFGSLPSSLTEFYFYSVMDTDATMYIARYMLGTSGFLPHLRIIDIGSSETGIRDLFQLPLPITTTLMKDTGKLGPVQAIHLDSTGLTVADILPLESTLTSLDISPFGFVEYSTAFMEDLLACSPTQFCNLKHISVGYWSTRFEEVGISDDRLDWSLLLQFAARYQIEELVVNEVACDYELSQTELSTLSLMKWLKRLHVVGGFEYGAAAPIIIATETLFQPHSWPQLETLVIKRVACAEEFLVSVCSAAPSCRHLVLYIMSNLVSATTILAIVLLLCPNVIDMTIKTRKGGHVAIQSVIKDFEKYPINAVGIPSLIKLSMPALRCGPAALHYLAARLSVAPNLAFFLVPPVETIDSLSVCCLRSLCHLPTLPWLNNFSLWKEFSHIRYVSAPVSEGCLKYARTREFVSPMERYWKSGHHFDPSYQPETADEFLADIFGYDTAYEVFRGADDSTGVSGRDEYFSVNLLMLSREQRAELEAWDRGNYSSAMQTKTTSAPQSTTNTVDSYY